MAILFLAIFSGDIMAILSGDHFGEVFLTILSDAPVWMGCDKIRNLQNAVLLQKSEGKQMGCATVWLSEASKLYISTEKWGQTHVLSSFFFEKYASSHRSLAFFSRNTPPAIAV